MSTTVTLDVTGMTCAACAARVARVLERTEGVERSQVNLALERADVEVASGVGPERLVQAIRAAGYGAHLRPAQAVDRRAGEARMAATRRAEQRRTLLLFAFSAAFTVPLVVAVLPMMLGLGPALLGPWAQMALATPVMAAAGGRFLREAAAALRGGSANMAVLVVLGTGAAYAYSAWRVVAGDGHEHLYFEAAAVVLTLVLLGKYIEARAKSGASAALTALTRLQPATAERLTAGGGTETVPVEHLRPGDRVLVRPGARLPADGVVASGRSSLDEALVTGESMPVAKGPGDRVVAGTVNGEGALEVTVVAVGEDTRLARIARLVEAAQTGAAPIQRLVDRVSAVFVPVVFILAGLTFALWASNAGFETALVATVSVLVIACPCALGLATPTALVAGTGAAARAGILIRDLETLERAHRIDTVAFDKTGTLTEGRPAVVAIVPAAAVAPGEALRLAAGLARQSDHPLADALARRADADGLAAAAAEDVRAVPGRGMRGSVEGATVLVGNAAMMAEAGIDLAPLAAGRQTLEEAGRTLSFVARDGVVLGLVAFADQARPEARQAVASLRAAGIRTLMLTGDAPEAAAHVAAELGIDEVRARLSPEAKLELLRSLQAEGRRVAFVGDGLNDGPALAAADLGIAMSGGTDLAREAAALTLLRPDLRLVSAALSAARRTRATIRQNLVWAFLYNVIGLPLAALGVLSPALAGAAMALSSVSVVGNAARLARWTPRFQTAPNLTDGQDGNAWNGLR